MGCFSFPHNYKQDDGFESQIPDTISCIAVCTSHIFLFVACLFLLCKQLVLKRLAILLILLYTTSIIHWQHPLFKSFASYADLVMVYVTICYGIYATYYTSKLVFTIWMVALLISTPIFITNEMLFCFQVRNPKNIQKSNPEFLWTTADSEFIVKKIETIECQLERYFSLEPTWPLTKEREYAYYRSTITHCIGVHFVSGIAGVSVGLICLFL